MAAVHAQIALPLTMSYGPQLRLPAGARPSDVAMADFDHDGRLDVAVTERGHDTLAIFRQLAGGVFGVRAGAKYYVPSAPASLVNLPLDGYGPTGASPTPPADDLALGCADNAFFYLFDNAGTAPGVLALTPRPIFLWQNTSSVPLVNPRLVTGRFNADPWFDLGYMYDARNPRGLGGIAIPRNSTAATVLVPRIQFSTTFLPFRNFTPVDFSLADLVGRGVALDAVLPSPDTNEVIVVEHAGRTGSFNGSWWDTADETLPSFGVRPVSAAAADLDGDGGVDVAAAHATSLDVVVQLHEVGAGFLVMSPARLTYPLPAAPRQVMLADLNGDNRPELLVLLANSTLRVYRNTGQSGQNLFDLASGALLLTNPDPVYMRLADINADGRPDVVVPCRGDDTVVMFYSSAQLLASAPAAPAASVEVYPNPARTVARVTLPGSATGPLVLRDALGRAVKRWPAGTLTLAVEDLPRGVYLLRIELPSGPVTRRLILE